MILGITLIVTHLIAFYIGFLYRMTHLVETVKKGGSFSERYAVAKIQKAKKKKIIQ